MKNPNGYGSVFKLGGKRRKPYGVRITAGWSNDGKQIYKYVSYHATRPEAMMALAEYNRNPYDLDAGKITFQEAYERFSEDKYPKLSKSNVNGYKASYNVCGPILGMRFADIRKSHLQAVVDGCGKNYPTIRKLKVFLNQMFRYAMENDLIAKDYSKFVETAHLRKGTGSSRKPFSPDEVQRLWQCEDRNRYVSIILMLIYSGVRISELLNLKKCDVHLEERFFDVVKSKTEGGVRKVPISHRTLPFFTAWMGTGDGPYLLSTPEGKPFSYDNYYDSYWKPIMAELGMEHRPHDTRHTTVSLLAAAKVDQTIIKRIVGHSGAMSLTERVYTHFEIRQLVDAIDLI